MPDPVAGCDVLNRSSLYFSYDQEVSTVLIMKINFRMMRKSHQKSLLKNIIFCGYPLNHAPQVIKQLPTSINEQLSKNF